MLDPAHLDFGAREDLLLTVLEKLIAVAAEAPDDEARGWGSASGSCGAVCHAQANAVAGVRVQCRPPDRGTGCSARPFSDRKETL